MITTFKNANTKLQYLCLVVINDTIDVYPTLSPCTSLDPKSSWFWRAFLKLCKGFLIVIPSKPKSFSVRDMTQLASSFNCNTIIVVGALSHGDCCSYLIIYNTLSFMLVRCTSSGCWSSSKPPTPKRMERRCLMDVPCQYHNISKLVECTSSRQLGTTRMRN